MTDSQYGRTCGRPYLGCGDRDPGMPPMTPPGMFNGNVFPTINPASLHSLMRIDPMYLEYIRQFNYPTSRENDNCNVVSQAPMIYQRPSARIPISQWHHPTYPGQPPPASIPNFSSLPGITQMYSKILSIPRYRAMAARFSPYMSALVNGSGSPPLSTHAQHCVVDSASDISNASGSGMLS